MSPIDDELRAALHARADRLQPAPDPLGGIESRARGMRRRRTLASVTGAALAVAAIAVTVPAVTGGGNGASPEPYGSQTAPATSAYALDPSRPWAFRGTPLTSGTRDAFQREWEVRHPGSTITPLFAQVYEPSGQEEALFVARGDGTDRLGVMAGSESGPEVVWESTVTAAVRSIGVVLPGDEVGRVLVVAAPAVDRIEYAPYGTRFTQLAELAPGVAVGPHEGSEKAAYRVLAADGSEVDRGALPVTSSAEPTNVLPWVARGDYGLMDDTAVRQAYAHAVGTEPELESYHFRPLFTGDTDSGVRYTVGQAWASGDAKAHTFGYATGGTNGPQVFLGPLTPDGAELVALLVDSLPGTTTDLLVLVPRPGTGQLSYSPDATSPFRPVANGRSDLDGVGLVDRSTTATNDRVEQLDGDGNLDRPIYRGPLQPYLCGAKECG